MIILIHGDDTAASRNYFLEQKQKVENALSFTAEELEISKLVQIFEGGGLFSDAKNIFIEDFLSRKKPGKDFQNITSYLKDTSSKHDIYLWEGKEVTKINLSFFPKCDIKVFKLPKGLFQFIDAIKPGNNKNLVLLFHNVLQTSEPEFVFYMIIRQFRMLLALSDSDSSKQIDEIKNLASWQTGKLKRQAGYFYIEKLKAIYSKLFEIDFLQKTGRSTLSLTAAIDFLLLDI